MKYRIVGNHTIDGTEPGKTITVDDEDRARRLVRAGHLAPVRKPAKKPDDEEKTE